MNRKLLTLFGCVIALQGVCFAQSETDRIVFIDRSDSNAGWVSCWSIAENFASMLDQALKGSSDPALQALDPGNITVEILEYRTFPLETGPKTALFPGDAHRCLNVLKIKARLVIYGCTGVVVYEEVLNSDHVLDFDHLQYDYCRYTDRSNSYPLTPLAHAHGDFIRDLYARIVRLHQKGML